MRNSRACLSIMSFVFLLCAGEGSRAENIFEMIFGGGQHSAESHRIAAPSQQWNKRASSPRHFAHKRGEDFANAGGSSPSPLTLKLSYAEAWGGQQGGVENCCASAADMIARVTKRDPTLRQGDAFMTSDGLQVFIGDRQGDAKFVPVGQAPQLSRALQDRLQAMEKWPSGKALRASTAQRSFARATPAKSPAPSSLANSSVVGKAPAWATKDRLIETPDGKTIRLVGGYVN